MKNNTLQVILDHWQVKIVCLLMAFCVYFLVSFSSTENRMVEIPLSVNLPTDYVAESLVPSSITVKITGSENIIYLIDPALITASVDFSGVNTTGISREAVILDYDEKVFRKGNVSVFTVPSDIRISFKVKESNE
jgi:YbbR domain-containing protein